VNSTARTVLASAGAAVVLGLTGTATAAAAGQTTVDHHQAVAAVAQQADTTNDQPVRQSQVSPATYTTQQVDSSGAVKVGVGTTGVILLGFLVWYAVKHHNQKPAWIVVAFLLGVTMAGSSIGSAGKSLVNSGVTAVSGVAGSVTN
jgi:RsiW-degrading membrane proteinase PrsW (M82 family)